MLIVCSPHGLSLTVTVYSPPGKSLTVTVYSPPGLSLTVTVNLTNRPSAARPRSRQRPSTVVSMLPPHRGITTLYAQRMCRCCRRTEGPEPCMQREYIDVAAAQRDHNPVCRENVSMLRRSEGHNPVFRGKI